MENIIETRYLNIFRFFNSKYSPPVSIHLLQRFNSDSNACLSLFCGIASSACVWVVLIFEMSLKKHPCNFNFNFGNREKSHRAKSGECGGWFNTQTWFRAKNWRTMSEAWLGALFSNRDQVSGSRYSSRIRRILSIRRFKTSRQPRPVIIWSVGPNSLWIIPLLSKNVMTIAEIGLPTRLSSSNLFLSPKKRLYHRKTFALLKKSSQYTFCNNHNISDAFLPSFAWKLITALCCMLVFQHRQKGCLGKTVITFLFINRLKQNWYCPKEECHMFQTPVWTHSWRY